MPSRRRFLQVSSLGAVAALAPRAHSLHDPAEHAMDAIKPAARPLNILILGGTGFLGPHTVKYAMKRGHKVTLFNRGRTNPHLFPELTKLKGDRRGTDGQGNYSALEAHIETHGGFDAVIDTSAYYPRVVNQALDVLADHCDHYHLVTTISVYADTSQPNMDESAPVGTIDDKTMEDVTGMSYGPLKALCEHALTERMGSKASITRPGLIIGPGDPTDRFTYWPLRVRRGGEVLAPGNAPPNSDPVQYIDVRDLAQFMVHLCETKTPGTFTANGPAHPTNMAELLHGIKAVTGGDATFTWVPAQFLSEHQVSAWMHMPLWVPVDGDSGGLHQMNLSAAINAGLKPRPLAETVRDLLAWYDQRGEGGKMGLAADAVYQNDDGSRGTRSAGMSAKREKEVLAAWHGA